MPKPEMTPVSPGPAIQFLMHANTLWEESGTPAAQAALDYLSQMTPHEWVIIAMRFARVLYTVVPLITDDSPEEFYASILDRMEEK